MDKNYDLFKEEKGGECVRIETVRGLTHAKMRIAKLASITPGTYFIYDNENGKFIESVKESA